MSDIIKDLNDLHKEVGSVALRATDEIESLWLTIIGQREEIKRGADELTRLRSLNEELCKALRLFAQYVSLFETRPDECPVSMHVIRDGKFTVGDLRNAAAALARAGATP